MATTPTLFSFFLLTLPLLLLIPSSSAQCHPGDRSALLQMKADYGNPPSLASWNISTDCCTWTFVFCDATGVVTTISAAYADLSGSISPAIGRLSSLSSLDLDGNSLTGPIPGFLAKLTNLSSLSLSSNKLSGPISPAIGRLSSLTLIFLDGNSLTGPIPGFLAKLTNLSYLKLTSNKLSGPIPAFLAQLTKLNYLYLAFNKLSGPIPAFLAELPLNLLELTSNHLTGTIPASLGQSSTLQVLSLDHNSLTGPIPASFAGSGVTYLQLENNQLTGDPSVLFGRSMAYLYLQRNRFKFNLSEVTFPTNLVAFDIHDNMVYGGIPKQINELKNLRYLNVSYNHLCGEIPITGRLGRIPQLKETAFAHNKCLCGSPLPACS